MYLTFALAGLIITLVVSGISIYHDHKGITVFPKVFSEIGKIIDRFYPVFLILILAVFLISRILKLDSFPNGFHVDELSMAADAKSILLEGTDRWGIHYPAYFQNYGGGMNALYIYIEAIILSFLPSTIFAFRIQAVFWGAVCLFMVFGICRELTGNNGYALIGPALVTTLPVYIMSERWGLEAYLFLPFSSIVLFLLIRAIKYQKVWDFLLAGIFMGASLYTYAVSYIVWPIFLVLTGVYLIRIRKIRFKQVLVFGIPLAVLAFPLILFQLVNFGLVEPLRLGISDYLPLPVAREEELGLSHFLWNFTFYPHLLLGGEDLTYNSFAEFGTIYMFLIPFVLAGFVICIKETVIAFRSKEFSIQALILFFWVGATVFMHLVKGPNVNRVNEIFLPFLLFIVIAVWKLFALRPWVLSWLAGWLAVSFVFFMYFYFFVQNDVYGYHAMHTSATPGKAIWRCENSYLKDENTHIYVQFEDIAIEPNLQAYYFAGKKGEKYSEDNPTYGNVTARLPEEIDVNENAIYIIGDQWPHITAYLISEGFAADQSLPGYSILFRPN